MGNERRRSMNKKPTFPEEAKRLLTAIFAKGEEKDPNEMTSAELEDTTPKTLKDKVSDGGIHPDLWTWKYLRRTNAINPIR